uniref:Uncharacterized protein n=1 Tax=Rhizophora mucronata TaxID=61149 RepID=A0A2P2J595_RHIMU
MKWTLPVKNDREPFTSTIGTEATSLNDYNNATHHKYHKSYTNRYAYKISASHTFANAQSNKLHV